MLFKHYFFENEKRVKEFSQLIAKYSKQGMIIYLKGDLGTGKTTFAKFFIQYLGYNEFIKSPTYSLVETYHIDEIEIHHFDLYRLSEPEELDYIGIRDYISKNAIWLIEWPSKGTGYIPLADITITISIDNNNPFSRNYLLEFNTQKGQQLYQEINKYKLMFHGRDYLDQG